MSLHFTREEFVARRKATIAAPEARGLSGLLMFRQESMYYRLVTPSGYVFPVLLPRRRWPSVPVDPGTRFR